MKKSADEFETWMNRTWRPATAWAYIIICIFDFLIFPILWSILQAYHSGIVSQAWEPITMSGGGLLHLSMGAILGIYAFSRGQEKMLESRVNNRLPRQERNYQESYHEQQQQQQDLELPEDEPPPPRSRRSNRG